MKSLDSRNPMLALANAIYDVRPPVLEGMKIDVDKNGLKVVHMQVALTPELVKAWGDRCGPSAPNDLVAGSTVLIPIHGRNDAGRGVSAGASPLTEREFFGVLMHCLPEVGGEATSDTKPAPLLEALAQRIDQRTDAEVASILEKLDALKPEVDEILSGYHHSTCWIEYRDQVEKVLRKRIGHRISHEVAAKVVGDDGSKP